MFTFLRQWKFFEMCLAFSVVSWFDGKVMAEFFSPTKGSFQRRLIFHTFRATWLSVSPILRYWQFTGLRGSAPAKCLRFFTAGSLLHPAEPNAILADWLPYFLFDNHTRAYPCLAPPVCASGRTELWNRFCVFCSSCSACRLRLWLLPTFHKLDKFICCKFDYGRKTPMTTAWAFKSFRYIFALYIPWVIFLNPLSFHQDVSPATGR